jgi:hypothetical protein
MIVLLTSSYSQKLEKYMKAPTHYIRYLKHIISNTPKSELAITARSSFVYMRHANTERQIRIISNQSTSHKNYIFIWAQFSTTYKFKRIKVLFLRIS